MRTETIGRRALLGLVAAALLSGCEPGDPGSSRVYFDPVRYRLTAEVETPQGIRTGSRVIQTIWDRGISGATVTGEAVAVDLPKGQTLFILLRTADNPDWASGVPGVSLPKASKPPLTAEEREAEAEAQVAWMRANTDVHYLWGGKVPRDQAKYLPYFVRFRDVRDPKSVEQVDPDDLAKSFGPGYRLKSLTVTFTDAPVTKGIEKRFVWWSKYKDRHFDGTPTIAESVQDPDLAAHLASGDFSTEFLK